MRIVSLVIAVCSLTLGAPFDASAASNHDFDAIVKEISPQRIETSVRRLASFGTRHALSDTSSESRGTGTARGWIATELERCSRANGSRFQVMLDEFVAEPNARILRPTTLTGGENDSATRELARFVTAQAERHVKGMKVELSYRRDRYLRGGDRAAFLDQGYPAIRFVETSENFFHQQYG